MEKKRILNNQKGAIAVIFAILIVVLIGFIALGIDAGRWYAAKEKAQEACDAAVLAGIQAYGSPNWKSLAEDVARENLPQGYLGFQRGANDIKIVGKSISGEARVEGNISATATTFFAGLIGIDTVDIGVACAAGRVPYEIMLVLDRSSSMDNALDNLKDAAKSFVDHFVETEDVDKMGLITFATGVMVDYPLSNNFAANIKDTIKAITIRNSVGDADTNVEDALDQADDEEDRKGDDTTTFTKYAWNIPQSQRAKQFLVLFTDGDPSSFRGTFTRNDITYDGVIPQPGSASWNEHHKGVEICLDGGRREVSNQGWLHDPYYGTNKVLDENGTRVNVCFLPTGDGKPDVGLPELQLTQCKWDCHDGNYPRYKNTKWHVFDGVDNSEYDEYEYGDSEGDYSIDEYCRPGKCRPDGAPCCSSPYCNVFARDVKGYVCDISQKMTKYHARKLKEQGVIIYCIGAGNAKSAFLKKLANTEDQYFKATYENLTKIFNDVANSIKGQVHLL